MSLWKNRPLVNYYKLAVDNLLHIKKIPAHSGLCFQRKKQCADIPSYRHISSTDRPDFTCFLACVICSSKNRTTNILPDGEDRLCKDLASGMYRNRGLGHRRKSSRGIGHFLRGAGQIMHLPRSEDHFYQKFIGLLKCRKFT